MLKYGSTRQLNGGNGLNEKRIQQVLEFEKQANAIRDAMIVEASQLPVQAEKEAETLIEKARQQAEAEAKKLIESAHAEEETAEIMAQAEATVKRTEALALGNMNSAVTYVIARVIGRE
jgi:vacuolar-type H+-ATPase subunit H